MTRSSLVLFGACAGIALGGCASDPNMQLAQQPDRECKIVTVYSAADEYRYKKYGTADVDEIHRIEAEGKVARLAAHPPRGLRANPGTGLLHDALRDC